MNENDIGFSKQWNSLRPIDNRTAPCVHVHTKTCSQKQRQEEEEEQLYQFLTQWMETSKSKQSNQPTLFVERSFTILLQSQKQFLLQIEQVLYQSLNHSITHPSACRRKRK